MANDVRGLKFQISCRLEANTRRFLECNLPGGRTEPNAGHTARKSPPRQARITRVKSNRLLRAKAALTYTAMEVARHLLYTVTASIVHRFWAPDPPLFLKT